MQILDMFLILNFTTYHCTFPCNKKYAFCFLHETIDACNKMFGIGKRNRVNACYLKYIFEGEQMTHELLSCTLLCLQMTQNTVRRNADTTKHRPTIIR